MEDTETNPASLTPFPVRTRPSLRKTIKYIRTKSKEFISSRRIKHSSDYDLGLAVCETDNTESWFEDMENDLLEDDDITTIDYVLRHAMAVEALLHGELTAETVDKNVMGGDGGAEGRIVSLIRKRSILSRRRSTGASRCSSHDDDDDYEAPCLASFLSVGCRLQKDQGEGYEPGAAIRAVGQKAALEHLRNKTDKINGSKSSKMKVVIKKGEAKLTNWNPPETRSILQFKMGFLSIKYGILLQWNEWDGLIDLIVMRKSITNSFMTPPHPPSVIMSSPMTKPQPKTPQQHPPQQRRGPRRYSHKVTPVMTMTMRTGTAVQGQEVTTITTTATVEIQIESGMFGVETTLSDFLSPCVSVI